MAHWSFSLSSFFSCVWLTDWINIYIIKNEIQIFECVNLVVVWSSKSTYQAPEFPTKTSLIISSASKLTSEGQHNDRAGLQVEDEGEEEAGEGEEDERGKEEAQPGGLRSQKLFRRLSNENFWFCVKDYIFYTLKTTFVSLYTCIVASGAVVRTTNDLLWQ